MESPRNEDLVAALRDLRPSPNAGFATELDARAAAGFPRREQSAASLPQRLAERLRALPPRRLVATAGACTIAVVVVATAVVAITEPGSNRMLLSLTEESQNGSPSLNGMRINRNRLDRLAGAPPPKEFSAPLRGQGRVRAQSAEAASGSSLLAKPSSGDASAAQANSAASAIQELNSGRPSVGPYASRANRRDIERSAELVLATEAAEVSAAATKVFETVHSYDGIVLRSSIRAADEGQAAATFDLLIPSGRLSDALASFSRIAEVRSRHEATQDITAPTIGLRERLQDAGAKVESLLGQLAGATTEAERAVAEAKLRAERRHVAALRARLADLERRASFSRVSLQILSGEAAGNGSGDGGWSAGDALGDALDVLAIAAGVAVIGLSIALPLALICLLGWLAHRAWLRRARTRALG
jgi:uncharacterized protein DUF4349